MYSTLFRLDGHTSYDCPEYLEKKSLQFINKSAPPPKETPPIVLPMTHAEFKQTLNEALDKIIQVIKSEYDPQYDVIVLGSQPYMLNYKGKKHVFAFNPTAASITLTSTDGWGITIPSQTWQNLGFQETTRLTAASGLLYIKCTDEVAP